MPNKLIQITDKTLKEVINAEVILPSTYKEHFENYAREMNLDIDYEVLVEKEAQRRLNEADVIMEKTYCNLDNLQKTTLDAQEAIESQDLDKLAVVTKEIQGLKNAIGDLQQQLHTDSLTKVYNRKWMGENLIHDGEFFYNGVLMFIDLDNFKIINNDHGHIIGDKVLQYLSAFLRSSLKGMDIIRYAGDEFIIISKQDQMQICYTQIKQLQEDLLSKKLKATNGEPLYLSFSFGITKFEIGSNFRDVLEIADSLMYENKKNKRV